MWVRSIGHFHLLFCNFIDHAFKHENTIMTYSWDHTDTIFITIFPFLLKEYLFSMSFCKCLYYPFLHRFLFITIFPFLQKGYLLLVAFCKCLSFIAVLRFPYWGVQATFHFSFIFLFITIFLLLQKGYLFSMAFCKCLYFFSLLRSLYWRVQALFPPPSQKSPLRRGDCSSSCSDHICSRYRRRWGR